MSLICFWITLHTIYYIHNKEQHFSQTCATLNPAKNKVIGCKCVIQAQLLSSEDETDK